MDHSEWTGKYDPLKAPGISRLPNVRFFLMLLTFRLVLLVFLSSWIGHAMEISEILPHNAGGRKDEDDQSPGWIEIHNNSAAGVDLAGCHLTDNVALPANWRFPATTVAANGCLVVFASGKNRAVSGSPLHTNFQLNTHGEYLALSNAGGTIVSSFAQNVPS